MIKIRNTYFNSYPIIFHHNGHPIRFWHKSGLPLKKKVFEYLSDNTGNTFTGRKRRTKYPIPKKSKKINQLSKELTILMVSNLEEKGSACRSLDYYGFPYTVVGENIINYDAFYKYEEIIKFIPTVKTKYLMLLDTDDVFVIDGLEILIQTFEQEMNCKMLFNAECFDYPEGIGEDQISFETELCPKDSPFKFLNSGVWITDTEFLQDNFELFCSFWREGINDQEVFRRLYRELYPEIKIDHKCRYFQSLAWEKYLEEEFPGRMNLEIEIISPE